jgi:oligoribonuclease NrnB/cAMP/cGMP phosphodiesterase (DHH superfamily)
MFKHIIYHKACPDGFGSAYIAWKVLGDSSAYLPLSYYDAIPEIVNSKILVCDFSFNYETTMKLIKDNEEFYNIDHHQSAFDNLKDLSDEYKFFDINHSGAYLTWKYFFADVEVPRFIKYIEDYDLWKFQYEETKPFMLALNELPFNFKVWKKLEDENYLNELIQKGKILQSYQDNMVRIITKAVKIKSQKIGENKYKVAYVNTNLFKNEVANKLVSETDCDFSVVYNYDDSKNLTKFSLRSIDQKANVSEIAKVIGGGGHRNAAGYAKFGFHNSII